MEAVGREAYRTLDQGLRRFGAPLPAAYREAHAVHQYHKNRAFIVLITALATGAYLSYAVADRIAIPDVAGLSLTARLVLVVLCLLITRQCLARTRNIYLLEALVPLYTPLAAVVWLWLLHLSDSEAVATYVHAAPVMVLLVNVAVRSWFPIALVGTLLLSVVTLPGVWIVAEGNVSAFVLFLLTYTPFMLFSLFISWYTAYTERRLFILAQLDRLKTDALEAANRHLRDRSNTDALTGIPNRTLLHDRIEQAIARAQRQGSCFALLFIDLDYFKTVNDTHGHPLGDRVLQQVVARLTALIRRSDTLARVGGDEFILLLPDATDEAQAREAAARVIEALERPFEVNGITASLGCSVGIALYPEHAADVDGLQEAADRALYRAKESGRRTLAMAG